MTEIRVGDWVVLPARGSQPEFRGLVLKHSNTSSPHAILCMRESSGREHSCYVEDVRHCAPDPLPETLPAGTIAILKYQESLPRVVETEATLDATGKIPIYWGGWNYVNEGAAALRRAAGYEMRSNITAEEIDWDSYHAALHRKIQVSPLPTSPLDVECPFASLGAAVEAGGYKACRGTCGKRCSDTGGSGPIDDAPDGSQYHRARRYHFLALTGQKDSRPVGVASSTEDGSAIVGSERGDSGTGRAVGHASAPGASGEIQSAAAPSGFKAPRSINDVECGVCGAGPRAGILCRDDEDNLLDHPHALRVAAAGVGGVMGGIPKTATMDEFREHCRQTGQLEKLEGLESERQAFIDAAAIRAPALKLRMAEQAASDRGTTLESALACWAFDYAEALWAERERRMKGPGP